MKLQVQRQITASLENLPGRLAAICQIIGDHGINIEAICVVDSVDQSVVRLVTSDPPRTKQLLQAQHIFVLEADVLAVELMSQRGRLALISSILAAESINIDYIYGSHHAIGERTMMVMKVSDLPKAQAVLKHLETP